MLIFILNKHILWEPPYYLPGWAKHIALWPWWQLPHGYSQVTAGWQPPVSWPLWSCGRTAPSRKTDRGNKLMWKLFHHIYTHTHIFHRYRRQFYIYVFAFGKREKSHSKPPAYNSTHTVVSSLASDYAFSQSGKNSTPTFCHMTGRCCNEYICDGME